MKEIEKIGCIITDLSDVDYFNPISIIGNVSYDGFLFRFIIKSSDVFVKEPLILKDFNFAFRIAWLYPFSLSKEKMTDNDIYFLYGVYLGDKYFLNKDPIREKHIWKDIERGKRAKNYSEKGKDPGTVWLKLIDDGKGKIIKHEYYKPLEVLERIKKCSCKAGYEAILFSNNYKNIDGFKVCGIK